MTPDVATHLSHISLEYDAMRRRDDVADSAIIGIMPGHAMNGFFRDAGDGRKRAALVSKHEIDAYRR